MQLKTIRQRYCQILTFSLVGIINTIITYAIFVILLKLFFVNYLISSGLGYCCGLANSYFMNRKFTFKITKKKSIGEGSRFIVVNVAALLINLLLMKIFVRGFEILPEIAQVIAIAGSYCTNFIGNKFWTFRENIA